MQSSFLRSTASVVTVAVAICLPVAAQAQTRSFNIPAQSASSGIREFARQAGIQVTLAGRDGKGRTTNAVQGALDVREALDQLLSGTGLSVHSFDGRTAILVGKPRQAVSNDEGSIVVTGSRIARPELESAMPISVIKMAEAERLGRTNAYDALARDPALGIGQNLSSASTGWDAGISAPNLRNLGTNRSLTLIDGQRRVSSSARSSAVDIGMIPVGMIDRIEVVTGGAAAIYGADAVTGAVNIITKRDIESLNISATSGISQEGDASEHMVSLSTGGKFADDRGSFSIGGTWSKIAPLNHMDRFDRGVNLSLLANPANTGINDGIVDRHLLINSRQFYYAYEPTYWLNGKTYLIDNGVPREAAYGGTPYITGEFSLGNGGDGRNLGDHDQLRGGNESLAVMGRVDYEITDGIEYGGYFSYARQKYNGSDTLLRDDSRASFYGGAGGSVAYLDNPYLPAALRQVMLDNGLTRLNISRTFGNFPQKQQDHDREAFTINQSLGGNFTSGLRWQAFWQYGRTEDDVAERNIAWKSHWIAARDVIADPVTGTPVCRDAAARAAGCLPINIFSQEPPSDALLSYVMRDRREQRVNTQEIYGANVTGAIFSLPYGEVSIAAGVEHRKETLRTTDDPLALTGELAYSMGPSAHPELDVSSSVSEVYGEVVVPILRDLPFARRLEVEGAYRYSDYSTVGGTDTWKVGATWAPSDWISFRGVRSRSVRTPNFGELYEPQNVSELGSIDDPCETAAYYASPTRAANCAALGVTTPLPDIKVGPLVTTGGNPDLKPETSNSLTLGVVFQPKFLPGFDLAVDYWDINIKDVITTFAYNRLLYLCVDLPTIDNPYCDRIVREAPLGNPVAISSFAINASRLYARGFDIGANYRRHVGGGQLSLNFKGTYLIEQVTETTPGISAGDVIADGHWQNPRFRGTLLASYQIGKVGFALDTRFISASKYDVNTLSDEAYPDNSVPAKVYNDFSVQYTIADNYRFTFGVRNVMNVKPPYMAGIYRDNNIHGIVGRYFYTNIGLKF